jgi:hypothetical protein
MKIKQYIKNNFRIIMLLIAIFVVTLFGVFYMKNDSVREIDLPAEREEVFTPPGITEEEVNAEDKNPENLDYRNGIKGDLHIQKEDSFVLLSWTSLEELKNVEGFILYKKVGNGSWGIHSVNPVGVSTVMDDLALLETIYYRVGYRLSSGEEYALTPVEVFDGKKQVFVLSTSYDRNNVISDSRLTAYNSMSAAAIQSFLNSRNSFLAGYSHNGKTAASIIYEASIQYQINPQVILATLQKEKALITRTTADSSTLNWAMGCGSSSNFTSQINCGAGSFRNYHNDLISNGQTISGWKVGVNKQTLDCVWITPANRATAGQYTYTPHAGRQAGGKQPFTNSAATNKCSEASAYGGVYLFGYYMDLWFPEFTRSKAPVTTDLYFNSSSVTEGQNSRARFIINNNHDWPITLERLKIDVRDGSKIQDFGGFSNITIQPGSSYSFDQTRTMTSAGSYGATIRMRVNGNWYTPGSHSTKSLRVNPFDYSSIKLSKPLSFGANRYVGDELTANFELENTNSFVVNLARIKINFRKSGTATDFVGLSSQNVGAGGKLNFTDSIVPVSAGTYDARAVYNYNGRWAPLSSIVKVTINPSSIPAKIEASSLSIDNTSPMVGERLGASFYLTNNNSQAVTLSRVKIDVRGSGSAQDIVGVNNLTIQPGSSAKVKLEGDDFARYLASSGSFTGTIRFNYAGSWYTPGGGDRFSLGISVFDPSNVVVSPRLNLEPSSLLVSSEATASFGISYARPYKVRLERLKIDVRDGIKSQDFSGESGFILNPEQYSFNQSRVITERGTYACNVRIRVAGKWYSPSGQASSSLSVF